MTERKKKQKMCEKKDRSHEQMEEVEGKGGIIMERQWSRNIFFNKKIGHAKWMYNKQNENMDLYQNIRIVH